MRHIELELRDVPTEKEIEDGCAPDYFDYWEEPSCDCGATKALGVVSYAPGHSEWCQVNSKKRK